eukprot:4177733-Prymnesium_polylepis.1
MPSRISYCSGRGVRRASGEQQLVHRHVVLISVARDEAAREIEPYPSSLDRVVVRQTALLIGVQRAF